LAALTEAHRGLTEAEALGRWVDDFPNSRFAPSAARLEQFRRANGEPTGVDELLAAIGASLAGEVQRTPTRDMRTWPKQEAAA